MSAEHPEARLLDLIRGGRKNPSPPPRGRLSTLAEPARKVLARLAGSADPFDAASAVLGAAAAAAFVWLLLVLSSAAGRAPAPGPTAPLAGLDELSAPARPLSAYLLPIQNRRLFGGRAPEKPKGPSAAELAAGLELRGVIGSGAAREAVIFDPRTKSTHYIKAGERIRGLTVEHIEPSSVILSDGGQKVQLTL